jgi:hypothetical protein
VSRARVILLCSVSAASVAATLWLVLVFLSPSERVSHVSFDELTSDVAAGRVDEVRIDKRVYTCRVRGEPLRKQATGPEPTLARVLAFRPSDREKAPPKVFFEP